MPITKSAKKKMRADARKTKINAKIKAKIKSALKIFAKEPNQDALSKAYSALDKAVKKGVIPKARASRKKSRITKSLLRTSNTKAVKKTKPGKKS